MPISLRAIPLILLGCILLCSVRGTAQPDLRRWSVMVSDFEVRGWAQDMELLEPGSIVNPMVPELTVDHWREFSPWAKSLIAELEALPLAEHHADRALDRLLDQGMMRFKLVHAQSDRYRGEMEAQLGSEGLPLEWVILPMALTGWDNGYYGPGRRAGPWAMDMPTALQLGLEVRRGWDERHLPERMGPAVCGRIGQVQSEFPASPLLQVMAFVRGFEAARQFDADRLDADVLGWLHLLRVLLQVDRNFQRDSFAALWALRARDWQAHACATDAPLFFQYLARADVDFRMIRNENPWFTTDSIGLNAARNKVWLPSALMQSAETPTFSIAEWCTWRPQPDAPAHLWQHVVRSGEVLGTIARRCGVRIEDIQEWNGMSGDQIQVGQALNMRCPPPKAAPPTTPNPKTSAPLDAWTWHTVREGESYWTIAQQYPGVALDDLLTSNDTPPEALRPGMQIRIPSP